MNMDDLKQAGFNLNSYISVGILIAFVSATLWLNNSLSELKIGQVKQAESLASVSQTMQVKVDAISARIDAMGARIDGLVTRPELEARVSEMRLEQSKLELQLLRANIPPNQQTRR